MQIGDIAIMVGRKTNIMDNNDNIVDAIVTKESLLHFINMRMREIYLELAERFPEHYTITSVRNLKKDVAVYQLGGEAEDALYVLYVGVKYSPTADYYTRATRGEFKVLFNHNTDISHFTKDHPYYIIEAQHIESTDNEPDNASNIRNFLHLIPTPDMDVEHGLLLRYVEMPAKANNFNQHIHIIPDNMLDILATMVIADVWEAKGDWARSERAMNRARIRLAKFLNNYQPVASDEPRRIKLKARFNPLSIRRY